MRDLPTHPIPTVCRARSSLGEREKERRREGSRSTLPTQGPTKTVAGHGTFFFSYWGRETVDGLCRQRPRSLGLLRVGRSGRETEDG